MTPQNETNHPLILLPQDIAEKGKAFLREQGYRLRLSVKTDEATLCRDVVGCQAILLRNAVINRRVLEAADELKVIGRHGVGVDNVDVEAATELGVQVTYAPEANSNTVADHVIGCIVALAHNILRHDRELRGGNFEIRNHLPGADVAGKTLGIVGLGRIGSLVARKAALGLDMKVIALTSKKEGFDKWIERVDGREEFFRRSDFISLHQPWTPQTYHSISKREFGWMKPSAYLVNTARGEVVDEQALLSALQTKRIAGAALDVFEPEPPSKDNSLFQLDNVIVTPHSAALTTEAMERMALHAAQGIHDVLSGRVPEWPVNKLSI
jgi:D-3-phosphoglycerate dehydrogenase